MEKSVLESFVNTLKEADIKGFTIRYEGGNRISSNDTESTRLVVGSDCVYCIDTENNYGSARGQFNIKAIPYDDIDDVAVFDLTVPETLKILNSLGILDDDIKEFIRKRGHRSVVTDPKNRDHYGETIDPETKQPEIHSIIPGRVTSPLYAKQ